MILYSRNMSLGLKVARRKKIDLICNLVCPLMYLAAMLKSKCALVKHTNTQIARAQNCSLAE